MSDKREIALEAGRIINSPLFNSIFEELDSKYVKAWRNSADSIAREDWWHKQNALAAVRAELFDKLKCAAVFKTGKDDSQIQAEFSKARGKR